MEPKFNVMFWPDGEDTNQYSDLDGPFSEEEDDNERGLVNEEEERCPNCTSSLLEEFALGKNRHNVIRCQVCETLLCPHCIIILQKVRSLGGTQEKLQCKKCGAVY